MPMNDTPEKSSIPETPEHVARMLSGTSSLFVQGAAVPGLSSWVLDRKLGGGGFGEVWLATHAWDKTQEPRAIKFCTDPEARQRLVTHERNVVLRVMKYTGRHAHIVSLLDCNLDAETPWLMYEFVPGGTLADQIDAWRELPFSERLDRTVSVLHAISGALAACHLLEPPLVHRDLKPHNVLMAGPTPRVTDFGIGGVVVQEDDTATGALTAAGARLPTALHKAGTRIYAPPEQMGGSPPSPRDDVYALGVIAYQMLVGDLKITPGTDAPAELLELGVPSEFASLICQSVAVNPIRRPKDATVWEAVLAATRGADGVSWPRVDYAKNVAKTLTSEVTEKAEEPLQARGQQSVSSLTNETTQRALTKGRFNSFKRVALAVSVLASIVALSLVTWRWQQPKDKPDEAPRSDKELAQPVRFSAIPDEFGEYNLDLPRKVVPYSFPVDGELPPELRTTLGKTVTVGQLEVKPLSIVRRRLLAETTGLKREVNATKDSALVLTIEIRNVSNSTFCPMDPAFVRKADEATGDFPITRVVVDKKRVFAGGFVSWPKNTDPGRLKWVIETQQLNDAVPLSPGESREYVVITDATPQIVSAVMGAREPVQWRVQVRREPIEVNGKKVSVTAVFGVDFKPTDVKVDGFTP